MRESVDSSPVVVSFKCNKGDAILVKRIADYLEVFMVESESTGDLFGKTRSANDSPNWDLRDYERQAESSTERWRRLSGGIIDARWTIDEYLKGGGGLTAYIVSGDYDVCIDGLIDALRILVQCKVEVSLLFGVEYLI